MSRSMLRRFVILCALFAPLGANANVLKGTADRTPGLEPRVSEGVFSDPAELIAGDSKPEAATQVLSEAGVTDEFGTEVGSESKEQATACCWVYILGRWWCFPCN